MLVKREQNTGLPTLTGWIEDVFRELEEQSRRVFGIESVMPQVDLIEEKDHYRIEMAAPGMKPEDFDIEYCDGVLTISGERKMEKKEGDDTTYHRVETFYGKFSRSFMLPEDAQGNKITAEYENGILKIRIPKDKKKSKTKKIKIK